MIILSIRIHLPSQLYYSNFFDSYSIFSFPTLHDVYDIIIKQLEHLQSSHVHLLESILHILYAIILEVSDFVSFPFHYSIFSHIPHYSLTSMDHIMKYHESTSWDDSTTTLQNHWKYHDPLLFDSSLFQQHDFEPILQQHSNTTNFSKTHCLIIFQITLTNSRIFRSIVCYFTSWFHITII